MENKNNDFFTSDYVPIYTNSKTFIPKDKNDTIKGYLPIYKDEKPSEKVS
jgi:hypothetical protein